MGRVKFVSGSALIFALLVSASFPSQAQDKKSTQEVVDRLIGHEFWLRPGTQIAVYPTPRIIGGYKSADGKLKFDSVWACTDGNCTFHVIFASGISGYISGNVYDLERRFSSEKPAPLLLRQPEEIYPSFLNHLKPQEAERRRRLPGILLGMVKIEVLASAWGEPDRKEETRTSRSHKEKWLYPDGNALLFVDGRLAKIKN